MAAEWYYTTNKQQMGPVTWDELRELAESGILKVHDMVWTEGMDEWVKAINQQGLFGDDDLDPSVKKKKSADAKPPPGRRKNRKDEEEEEGDEEDDRESKKKSREREQDRARQGVFVKVGLILGGVVLVVLLGVGCCGGLFFMGVFGGGGGGGAGGLVKANYVVNLNGPAPGKATFNDKTFKFTEGKRVVITCTNNQLQFNNTDVDLRIFRGNNSVPNEIPVAWDDGLPNQNRNCRVEFVVPATDTYRVRIVNLGPGRANSCNVAIEER